MTNAPSSMRPRTTPGIHRPRSAEPPRPVASYRYSHGRPSSSTPARSIACHLIARRGQRGRSARAGARAGAGSAPARGSGARVSPLARAGAQAPLADGGGGEREGARRAQWVGHVARAWQSWIWVRKQIGGSGVAGFAAAAACVQGRAIQGGSPARGKGTSRRKTKTYDTTVAGTRLIRVPPRARARLSHAPTRQPSARRLRPPHCPRRKPTARPCTAAWRAPPPW